MVGSEKKTWYVTVKKWNNKTNTQAMKSYVCDDGWKANMIYDLLIKVFDTIIEFESD